MIHSLRKDFPFKFWIWNYYMIDIKVFPFVSEWFFSNILNLKLLYDCHSSISICFERIFELNFESEFIIWLPLNYFHSFRNDFSCQIQKYVYCRCEFFFCWVQIQIDVHFLIRFFLCRHRHTFLFEENMLLLGFIV